MLSGIQDGERQSVMLICSIDCATDGSVAVGIVILASRRCQIISDRIALVSFASSESDKVKSAARGSGSPR